MNNKKKEIDLKKKTCTVNGTHRALYFLCSATESTGPSVELDLIPADL